MTKLALLFAILAPLAFTGCNRDTDAESSKSKTTAPNAHAGKPEASPKESTDFALKLFPQDAIGYLRIRNLARVRSEFIRPTHVKDAARIQRQVNQLLHDTVMSFSRQGGALGVKGETLLQLLFELDGIQFGAWKDNSAEKPSTLSDADLLAVLSFTTGAGVDKLLKELQPKLIRRKVAGKDVYVLALSPSQKMALHRPNAKSVVLGTLRSLESALLRRETAGSKSLADSPHFQQARRDSDGDAELFAYANLDAARNTVTSFPFPTVTHLGASLRLEGGLSVRGYSGKSRPFPKFLVRTSREKRFLSRIPADAVFLLSAVTDSARQTRRNFFEWVVQELGRDEQSAKSLLPQSWRRFAEAYTSDPKRIEGQAFAFVEDLWLAVLPVKSESAFFIAPDQSGRYGAAFLFDIEDRDQVRKLTEQLFEMGNRAKLPWKETTHDGLTIRYVDFAEVAKAAGRPVPPEIERKVELKVGYAQGKELFFVGTLEAIRFAHKPAGRTLDRELTYDNVDAKNAIMLSLRPGRVLHRTFGVPQVDSVLKRLAEQIPRESNYAVTLRFEPTQLTFRTNIPFVSLIAWLVTEWQGHGRQGSGVENSKLRR